MLNTAERPLSQIHDLAVLDLDGVVYIGSNPVVHAAEALNVAVSRGMHLAYVTNNAARTPEQIADKLVSVGMPATPADVVTSAQAAAALLAKRLKPGDRVFVIGGEGLETALRVHGLIPVSEASDEVVAVVQGYGPEMPWRQVIAGAILVKSGLPWVASNTDMTIPIGSGFGPGNGTLVRLVAEYAGREPLVAGKPETSLFEETLERVGGSSPIMVGDRLDTDIEGANRSGWPSLLVFTGVTDLDTLVAALPHERPTYLGMDLRDLHVAHPAPVQTAVGWSCGGYVGSVIQGKLSVTGSGDAQDALDAWRVAAAAAWNHLDVTGTVVDVVSLHLPR